MKKAKKFKKVHYIDVGSVPAFIGFCDSSEAFALEMKRLGVQNPPDGVSGFATASTHTLRAEHGPGRGNYTTIIICFPNWRRLEVASLAACCAHEASHAADSCFETMGEEAPGEEVRAYLIQYITQQLITYLKS